MVINSEYLKSVGMEIKIARIRKGFSILQLAKQTGLSKGSLHRLEQGKHDFRILTLKRIADALEVYLNDLLVTLPSEKR